MTAGRPTRPAMVAIGGCHRDLVARTGGRFEAGTSCPGSVVERAGGVARNVAVLLAGAGIPVRFAGRVGADATGSAVLAGLVAAGVDVAAVRVDPDAATGTYLAVHDETGELVAAVSDLGIYDRIAAADVLAARPDPGGFVFADANLPAATLAVLAAAHGEFLAVDAISRAKADRILVPARAGALVFANLPSAGALAGRSLKSPAEAAEALRALGVTRAIVTGGPLPVAILADGAVGIRSVPAVPVVDVTGAGDALTAGTLAALAAGRPLADAVDVGIRASAAALACRGALPALPPDIAAACAAPAEPRT